MCYRHRYRHSCCLLQLLLPLVAGTARVTLLHVQLSERKAAASRARASRRARKNKKGGLVSPPVEDKKIIQSRVYVRAACTARKKVGKKCCLQPYKSTHSAQKSLGVSSPAPVNQSTRCIVIIVIIKNGPQSPPNAYTHTDSSIACRPFPYRPRFVPCVKAFVFKSQPKTA